MAARGYPGAYERGQAIAGVDDAAAVEGAVVFGAGTASVDGRLVTNGGRVLAVTAVAPDHAAARERAYHAIDRIDFHHPVQIGNLVRLLANVNYAGRTSVEVGVRVEAEDLTTGMVTHTNSAYLVFVALSGTGRPIPVPRLTPVTDEQKAWYEKAAERRRKRLAEREPAD